MDLMQRRRAMMVAAQNSGGGGFVEIISEGTFAGNGQHYIGLDIGTRFPLRDFLVVIWLDDGATLPYDTNHKIASLSYVAPRELVEHRYGQNGASGWGWWPIRLNNYSVDNDGTVTTLTPAMATAANGDMEVTIRQNDASILQRSPAPIWWTVSDGRAYLHFSRGNSVYKLASGMTYNYRIIYYGSDPDNDIYTV